MPGNSRAIAKAFLFMPLFQFPTYRGDDFSVEGFVAESERLESQLRPYTNDSFHYKFIGCNTDAADGAVAGGYPCALWQLG